MGPLKQNPARGKGAGKPRQNPAVWLIPAAVLAVTLVLVFLRPWERRVALPDSLTANSVVILDGKGNTLAELDSDTPRSPSSLTKLLTLYLIFDDIDSGKLSLTDTAEVTVAEATTLGSKYGLTPGQEVTVEQLLAGTILNSGCDCVQVLVRLSAGGEAAFVERMNEAAAELGLKGSHFVNATGLDASGHYMTARDLATLSWKLVENHPEYLDYSSQSTLTIDGLTFTNLNKLVGADPRVLGLKTGTTSGAGYCFTGTAMRNGRRIISVVMNTTSYTTVSSARKTRTIRLRLNCFFLGFSCCMFCMFYILSVPTGARQQLPALPRPLHLPPGPGGPPTPVGRLPYSPRRAAQQPEQPPWRRALRQAMTTSTAMSRSMSMSRKFILSLHLHYRL